MFFHQNDTVQNETNSWARGGQVITHDGHFSLLKFGGNWTSDLSSCIKCNPKNLSIVVTILFSAASYSRQIYNMDFL
jgi:hypothetical protein